eukprot:GFKZ01004711.1.p1 GENE.GFKZ01004711.1~~GFKZ01004711.1.p1  ORF type:complete len:829 (+),score=113.53 GFKZ01004711.1:305-2791(+)
MDDEDYFGQVTVPLNEEEEDAANDLTFGDIGDIKAGDEASDAAWKPDHQSLASKIEAEKEALHRGRRLQEGYPPHSKPLNYDNAHQNGHFSPSQQAPMPPGSSAWELLKRLQQQPQASSLQTMSPPPHPQNAQQATQSSVPQPLPGAQGAQMLQISHLGSLPMHTRPQPLRHPRSQLHPHPPLHLLQPQLNQFLPHHSPPQVDARSREYQRLLIAQQEQQTRRLLQQHIERAERQLGEAKLAQQAGVTFDRNEFDRHQEATRQSILSDHYNRIRQIQYMVWQANEQLRQAAGSSRNQPQAIDPVANIDQQSPHAPPMAHDLDESVIGSIGIHNRIGNPGPAQRHQFANGTRGIGGESPMERGRQRINSATDEDVGKTPRMQEIERQMAAAGLGPSGGRRASNTDAFGLKLPAAAAKDDGQPAKKSSRRLESMTDRDQELVFRAHLRQIESSVLYKDDYYNTILRQKQKLGEDEIFSELAEKVQSLRLRDKQRRSLGHPIRIRGKRIGGEDQSVAASPTHSDQNMRALANALGTVQSWNPRAPRRVMDFGLLEKREPLEDGHKSLQEDERVQVRLEVERGYDLISAIHDIARGESQQSLGPSIKSLLSTLHLAERIRGESDPGRARYHSTQFFATMCVIQKGRRYLPRVLEIIDVTERVRVMSAIFENLGMLIFAAQKGGDKLKHGGLQTDIFAVITRSLQDPEVSPNDSLLLFESFTASHVPHRDAFLTAFRSSVGSRLIFLCLQKISAGVAKQTLREEDLALAQTGQFVEVFSSCLKDTFDCAESVGRVWEVAASLDALTTGKNRAIYRAELNKLIRSGDIPPPPSA